MVFLGRVLIERERESAFFPGVFRPCDLDISVGSVCIGGDRVRAVALWGLNFKVGIYRVRYVVLYFNRFDQSDHGALVCGSAL